MPRELVVATCQFPVTSRISGNLAHILDLLARSGEAGAQIAHFPESSLSGYAGVDFDDLSTRNEDRQSRALQQIRDLCRRLNIWCVVGGHAYSSEHALPYNCLWVIAGSGAIHCRYDKRICMGVPGEGEHRFYQPGRSPVLFNLGEIRCGLLICHEFRYPELYRQQKSLGAEIVFQSWYDGNLRTRDYEENGIEMGKLIVGTTRGSAANNSLWISGSNTSKPESCFGSFLMRPDGRIHEQLERNTTDLLLSTLDFDLSFSDPSGPWRDRVARGVLNSLTDH